MLHTSFVKKKSLHWALDTPKKIKYKLWENTLRIGIGGRKISVVTYLEIGRVLIQREDVTVPKG